MPRKKTAKKKIGRPRKTAVEEVPVDVTPEKSPPRMIIDGPRKDDSPAPGKALLPDHPNPPVGDPGHLCLDLQGRYQPDWLSLMIMETPNTQSHLPFNGPKRERWNVKVGVWVDVPPYVVQQLADLKYDDIKMDYKTDMGLSSDRVEVVKKTSLAFQFSYRPSA